MHQKAINHFVSTGALFVINHSAGKDSQAMTAYIRSIIPAAQIVVIHAHLPGVEWEGVVDHIKYTIGDLEYIEVRAGKTLLEMVERRGMWPSSSTRQCTSDLKRGPIEKAIRLLCKERGYSTVINCMGIRAEESPGRAKKAPFKMNRSQSIAGRHIYNWLPIHDWHINQVWETISAAGQKPHWAYGAGMSRLSCCFCILASKKDLQTAAQLNPVLYDKYVALEKKINHTIIQPKKGQQPVYIDNYLKN